MRTLVISDLHLGARPENDVLRRPEPRAALLEALASSDRLVLLGDTVELRHGPVHAALAAATPVLAELGAALGAGGEVVLVPGNHDHHLLEPWVTRRGTRPDAEPLGLETAVDWAAGEPLAVLAAALEPAQVRAAYPGLWLSEDVYAIHGHYSDRHNLVPILERLGAGLMARVVGEPRPGPRAVGDYEGALAPMYALIDAVVRRRPPQLEAGEETFQVRTWRRLHATGRRAQLRAAGFKALFAGAVGALNAAGLGPLRADVSGPALRRGGLYGMTEVAERLNIPARHVIFGHTHRAGPLPADQRAEWLTPSGKELLNTGCWLWERSFVGDAPRASPYRPGFCVLLEDGGPPRLVNLLDREPARERLGEAANEPAPPRGLGEARGEADRVAVDPG